MQYSTGNADKKSTTTSKKYKTEENAGICRDKKEKSNSTSKTNNSTWRNKSEGTGERRKIKKISRQDKTIQTKQNIPKQQQKFYQQVGVKCTNTYQQPDDKETK